MVAEHEVRQSGDILRAVIGNAREPVGIKQHLGSRRDAVFSVEVARIDKVAVGDAANAGNVFPSPAFYLFRRGPAGANKPKGNRNGDKDAGSDAAEEAGIVVPKQLRELIEEAVHVG